MRVEVHVLQNFAPSNLNRDDTGSPKVCEFGDSTRARVSSQCWKRAAREYFKKHDLIPAAHRAVRTKRLLDHVTERLTGRDKDAARRAVTNALAAGGFKLDERNLTQYLLFLGEGEIARFTELVNRHFDALAQTAAAPGEATGKKRTAKQAKADAKEAVPDEVRKGVPALLDGGKAADLALFGRMLADLPDKNVDAACQVAHALSTNKLHSLESDYYTAVDDINNDNPGADMIGTVEFNSACFYRYASLDVSQLRTNLQGDAELTRAAADAFLRAFIHAVPTGKQNGFAAHNPPSLVFTVVRDGPPVSLANAFVRPVRPDDGGSLVGKSIHALDDFHGRLIRMYGDGGRKASFVCHMEGEELQHLKEAVDSAAELIDATVAAAFPAGGTA